MSDTTETRNAPERVRIGRMQEVQIPDLVRLDRACAEMYLEAGFDAAEVPARTTDDFYRLPKNHAVRVAEADGEVAGYVAYRDEAPGVVYVEELSVLPSLQRFGIATRLLAHLVEDVRSLGLGHVVLCAWERAPWAQAFYAATGFRPIDDAAPEQVRAWLELKRESGRPFPKPGVTALYWVVPSEGDDED
jgi:amino-acid N-acetyltransferase